MGDLENKNLEETAGDQAAVNEKQENGNQKAGNQKAAMPLRTCLVMILAGAYVAYLGVSLCQNVINGAEGSSAGFMVAGVIFVVLGVVFVINGIRGSIKASKVQKEQTAEGEGQASETEAVEEASGADISGNENTSSQGRKMSIADRANLVSQLGDANEDEKE